MAKHKKRPVHSIYAIAVVWIIFTLVHPLYRVSDYVTVILLSAVVFIVAKGIFPTVEYELPDPPKEEPEAPPKEEPAPEAEAAKEEAPEEPASTGDPKIDALVLERDRAIQEMRRLNDAIEDEEISRRIDQLEDATGKIIDQVIAHPEKLPQIRKFMNYYLPTTLKILNAYDRMRRCRVSGENIDGTMHRIETIMDHHCHGLPQAAGRPLPGMRPWTSPRTSPSWKPCWPKRGWRATSRTSTEERTCPMADEFIPELTLNPNSPLGSQAQAAPPKGAGAPQQPAQRPPGRGAGHRPGRGQAHPRPAQGGGGPSPKPSTSPTATWCSSTAPPPRKTCRSSLRTPSSDPHQGPGGDWRHPVRSGPPAPGLRPGGREEGYLRLLPAEEEPAGHPEGQLCQGLCQCG